MDFLDQSELDSSEIVEGEEVDTSTLAGNEEESLILDDILLDDESVTFDDSNILLNLQSISESNDTYYENITNLLERNNTLLSCILIILIAFISLSIWRKVFDVFR